MSLSIYLAISYGLNSSDSMAPMATAVSPTLHSMKILEKYSPNPMKRPASHACTCRRLFYQEPSGAISAVGRPTPLNLTWGSSTNIRLNMTEIALPRSAIAAASVFVGGPLPVSIDIWYQSNGSNIMESLDINATFTLTQLPV